jgi:hypothetical protein
VNTSLPSFDGRLRVEPVPRRIGIEEFRVGVANEGVADVRSYRDDMFMWMVEVQDTGVCRVYARKAELDFYLMDG